MFNSPPGSANRLPKIQGFPIEAGGTGLRFLGLKDLGKEQAHSSCACTIFCSKLGISITMLSHLTPQIAQRGKCHYPHVKDFFFLCWGCTQGIWKFSAIGQIRAVAASLPHSHSNTRSMTQLRPILQPTATQDP